MAQFLAKYHSVISTSELVSCGAVSGKIADLLAVLFVRRALLRPVRNRR